MADEAIEFISLFPNYDVGIDPAVFEPGPNGSFFQRRRARRVTFHKHRAWLSPGDAEKLKQKERYGFDFITTEDFEKMQKTMPIRAEAFVAEMERRSKIVQDPIVKKTSFK